MTWYVTRNAEGGIACAYQYEQDGLVVEAKAHDDAELVAFMTAAFGAERAGEILAG